MRVVLDSGGATFFAAASPPARAHIRRLEARGQWPPSVPTVVLIESLEQRPGRDANLNRLLASCDVLEQVPVALARRAAELRRLAGRGSAVDALVVALAEPNGTVVTGDRDDLEALASHATNVGIEAI